MKRDGAQASQTFSDRAGEAWVRLQDRTDAQIDPLGRVAIARLAPLSGERVLDVGCGCGQTLLELAELVGATGHVHGVDVSPPMTTRARERVAGRSTISLALGDAQTHAFASASFDAVFSRFGVMFFDDARTAFRNLRADARAGGRLGFVCWQTLERNPWAAMPLEAVMRRLPPSAMPDMFREGRPGPFSLGDRARVRTILEDAGWTDVSIEPVEMPLHVGGAATRDEAVAYSLQIGPAARVMVDARDEDKPELEAALREALAPFSTERGVFMDCAAWVVLARAE